MLKKILFILFAIFCILIGLYPLLMVGGGIHFPLLDTKSAAVLANLLWKAAFYGHVVFGGIALLVGWAQFSKKLRVKYVKWHRGIGYVYVIGVLVSSVSAIIASFYASGGPIAMIGFFCLGVVWLGTTARAFQLIRARKIREHQNWMILSYAACFAAVTLRIELPLLQILTGDFITAYRIIAWLSWVPNVMLAYWWIQQKKEVRVPA